MNVHVGAAAAAPPASTASAAPAVEAIESAARRYIAEAGVNGT